MTMTMTMTMTINMLPPDRGPPGGAGAEHPEGEEDGRDVRQAQRDHQGSILNFADQPSSEKSSRLNISDLSCLMILLKIKTNQAQRDHQESILTS